ncbi:branched-chain amino acid aminotransferase [Chitinispirillales bacterium ANBcel5]|uniref:branched-chain amino acid aminotransferase n=1 Tax=Cellulosispirillum alkaliphilum TaxID=3039283 RepID=UPI002A4F470F|nr:branched-chain amino acid aminotransferase [Chitinispirillales bacterium ANBcel5]
MAAPSIDWKNIGFQYVKTNGLVKTRYADGKWSGVEVCEEPMLNIHAAATCLHYGQACFEGLKAFRRKDGSIAIFRPEKNARRLIDTAKRVAMESPPEELFIEAVKKVVEINRDWVPPYGTGATFYIRPLLIGTSARVGISPSEEYELLVLGMPVGPYYKDGFYPVKAYVQDQFDRAAPRGVGNVKVAGNYAAGMLSDLKSREKGYSITLYLDAAQHQFIDEFGTSNFIAITGGGKYVTPNSESILPSITNISLQEIARDFGLRVECRPVKFSELASFSEVGACGTAAVITPIYSVTRGEQVFTFGDECKAGETLEKLFREIQGIQFGEVEDRHGWMLEV